MDKDLMPILNIPLLHYFKREAGVAAVEFALIAPVLVTIFLGMADFGRYLHSTLTLENTARAAGEYMVHGGDAVNIRTDVIDASNALTAEEKRQITVTTNNVCECSDGVAVSCTGSCGSGDFVRRYFEVTLSMSYDPTFSFMWLPDSINISEFVRVQIN